MPEKFYYETYAKFDGGLKTYPPPYKLSEESFSEMNSLMVNSHASLEMREGQTPLFTTTSGHEVSALTRATLSGGADRLVYGTDVPLSTLGATYVRNEALLTNTQISIYGPTPLSRFALFDSKVFWVTAEAAPAQVLYYDGNSVHSLGNQPPTTTATIAIFSPSSGSDAIRAIVSDPVYYWITFYDPTTGQESNPTTINGLFTPTNSLYQGSLTDPFRVALSAIPTATGKWRRLYRQGGGLPQARLIAEVQDTSTTTWEDNMANVTAIDRPSLSFSHDPPPTGFSSTVVINYLLVHKRRLLLFGETTVFISNLNEPWYYPLISTSPLTDGQVLPIDGDLQNPIRSACPIGGAVFIARAKDCWMLYGEDTDTFILSGVCTIGCIAPLSLVACGDIPVWLAPDRQVWAMTNTGPVPISEDIKNILKDVSMEDAANACACYHRNNYLLSFPSVAEGEGLFLVYDFDTKVWHEETQDYTTSRYLYSDTGASDGDEVLIGTTSDFRDTSGNPYIGVVRLYTDTVTPLDFVAESGNLLFSLPYTDKKIANIRILGTYVQSEGTVTLTLTALKERKDGTSTTTTATYDLIPNVDGVLLDTDVDASIVGQRITYRIAGVASFFKLDMVEFGYSIVGDRRS